MGSRRFDEKIDYQAVARDYFKVNDTGGVLSRHDSENEFVACGIMYTYESISNLKFYNEDFNRTPVTGTPTSRPGTIMS